MHPTITHYGELRRVWLNLAALFRRSGDVAGLADARRCLAELRDWAAPALYDLACRRRASRREVA